MPLIRDITKNSTPIITIYNTNKPSQLQFTNPLTTTLSHSDFCLGSKKVVKFIFVYGNRSGFSDFPGYGIPLPCGRYYKKPY